MKIESLDLPNEVKRFYLDSGILELYPLRQKPWKKGYLKKNLLAAIRQLQGKLSLPSLQC